MDGAIIAAIIGAVGAILAPVVGHLFDWWLKVRNVKGGASRRLFFIVIFIVLGGVIIAIGGVYVATTRFSSFAADFTPAWISVVQSNATNNYYVTESPKVPNRLNWYTFESESLNSIFPPQINYESLTHYLFYASTLHTKKSSWTGFLLSRKWFLPEFNLDSKSELFLVMESDEADTLEIGLKDVHGNENKIPLQIVKGWAGYRIPLSAFAPIDLKRIQLFLFAHSREVGSKDANIFKIAFWGTN